MQSNFVIGTGRCGSTLLSTLLSENRKAAVLSEFFGGLDMINRFSPDPMSGRDLAIMLTRDMELAHFWKTRSQKIKEILIDRKAHAERWGEHVPVLLEIALPMLTDEPEALFDEMLEWAHARPTTTLSEHYPALFAWLAQKLGRQMWIERSGTSFAFLDGLFHTFPDARFVHIHRDGDEAALSMLEHAHFRQVVSYHYDPPSDEEVRRTALHLDPEDNDPFRRRTEGPQDVRRFADYWSYQIAHGYSVMPKINPANLMEVRFEDLLADPSGTLQAIAGFFGMPDDEGWIDRALKQIRRDVPLRAPDLSPEQQQGLREGCYIGRLLLGRDTTPSPVGRANRIAREAFDAVRNFPEMA
jgi:putative sulfotransferase